MKIHKGLLAASLAPLFIATSVILVNVAGKTAHPLVLASYGTLISLIFLVPFVVITAKKTQYRKILTDLKSPFVKTVITRSILGSIFLIAGFSMTTAVKSILLLRLEPLMVFLWSVMLLKERPVMSKVLLIISLMAGAAFVVYPGNAISAFAIGDLFIFIALIFLSYSYIPSEKVVKDSNPYGLTILSNLFGGIAILVIALIIVPFNEFAIGIDVLGLIVGYAFAFYALGLLLYFYAFKTVKPWIISSLLSLEVVWGLFLALIVVGESITALQIIGSIVLIVSTYLIGRLNK